MFKKLIRSMRNTLWYTTPLGPEGYRAFRKESRAILDRRKGQTREQVEQLKRRYAEPIFGEITVWELLQRMAQVSDPTDTRFGVVNQASHTIQVLESMEDAGIDNEDMRVAALLHDLGKLLHLVGEAPENVFGMKSPIGRATPGVGLDRVSFQWNHDDFIYDRFKHLVSEPVAWLLRYHSIMIPECLPYMDERDQHYTENYLRDFQLHDQGSKSMYRLSRSRLDDYREWAETLFPRPVLF